MDQKTTYSYQRTPGLDCPKCGVYFPTTIPDLLSGSIRCPYCGLTLVSLVTLPLLQIKQADFDFDINIIDAVAAAPNEHFSLNRGEVESPGGKERDEGLNFRASLAPQSGRGASSSLQANMKIHVSMQQADMPSGLSQFLQLASRPHYEDVPSREKND